MAAEGLGLESLAILFGVPVDKAINFLIGQGDQRVTLLNAAHDIGEAAAHRFDGGLGVPVNEDAFTRNGDERRIASEAGGDADP